MQSGAKGIAYRLTEELGLIKRDKIESEIKLLDQKSRYDLRKLGVKIGKFSIFFPATVKPKATELLISLWINFSNKKYNLNEIKKIKDSLPRPGITSCEVNNSISHQIYKILGYLVFGKMAIRADIIERLDKLIYNQIEMDKKNQNFVITDEMIALLGCSRENIKFVIKYLGFTEINKNIKTSSSDNANEIEIKYKKKYKSKSNSQKKSKKAKHAKVGGESSNIFSENIDLINLKERL
jgi:ATP-dependent RNA helicase SUPV3L1/SUV3